MPSNLIGGCVRFSARKKRKNTKTIADVNPLVRSSKSVRMNPVHSDMNVATEPPRWLNNSKGNYD
ncbi:hypothetical protein MnTg02_03189 [bacterium MnTg02]|nr:hypothetical protein MnTg02_03189 [bacterium MnTg02]